MAPSLPPQPPSSVRQYSSLTFLHEASARPRPRTQVHRAQGPGRVVVECQRPSSAQGTDVVVGDAGAADAAPGGYLPDVRAIARSQEIRRHERDDDVLAGGHGLGSKGSRAFAKRIA